MAARRRRRAPRAVIDTDVIGVEETIAALRALPVEMQKSVVRHAVRAGASVLLREEALLVPIGAGTPQRPGGTLLRSLTVFPLRQGKRRTVVFVGAGPEGFYGRFLEFGTRFMPARPWLRPALHAAFAPVLQAAQSEISEGIDKTVREVARDAGSVREAGSV